MARTLFRMILSLALVGGFAGTLAADEADLPPGVQIELIWGSFGQGLGQFHQPKGIAIDAVGDLVVIDGINTRLEIFSPSGSCLRGWGAGPPGDAAFYWPDDVVVDPGGRIAVAQGGAGRVTVFSEDGDVLLILHLDAIAYATSIAVDADGYFYVGDSGMFYVGGGWDKHQIHKFSPDGTSVGTFGQSLFAFKAPGGMVVSAAGELITSDTGHDRILVFDTAGTLLRQWGSSGTGPGQFDEPRGVAVDPAGNVYVADTSNHRVLVFDSGGRFLLQWGSFGLGPGEFRYPWDVAVDGSGNVYVTDCFNHRVQKFRVTLPSSGGMLTSVQPTTWGRLKTMFVR